MSQTFILQRAARSYASVLFDQARAVGAVDVTRDFLSALSEMIEHDPHTVYPLMRRYKQTLDSAIPDFFKQKGCTNPDFIGRFLSLMANKNRFDLLPSIAKAYQNLYDKDKGILEVSVIAAHALSVEEKNYLGKVLSDLLGGIHLTFSKNPSLLAGFQILIGSSLYDLSLRAQLQQLQTTLTGVVGRYYEGKKAP